MGLFDIFKKKEEAVLEPFDVADDKIVAIADGKLIDIKTVGDPVFAEEMMGRSTALTFEGDKVVLCSPANGTLGVLFPTGHAFGIAMNDGTEILVHCGVNTVNANGDGFRLLKKAQGDAVKAGDPIVEVDLKKLRQNYEMSTMIILTANPKDLVFRAPGDVKRGDDILG